MTDIPELIERLRNPPLGHDGDDEWFIFKDTKALLEEAAEALSRLSAPLPGEIAITVKYLRGTADDRRWPVEMKDLLRKAAAALERMARDRKVLEAARDAAITYGQDRYQESLAEIARLEAERDRLLAVTTELDDHVNKAEADLKGREAVADSYAEENQRLSGERDAIRAKTIEECLEVLLLAEFRDGMTSRAVEAIRALAGKE